MRPQETACGLATGCRCLRQKFMAEPELKVHSQPARYDHKPNQPTGTGAFQQHQCGSLGHPSLTNHYSVCIFSNHALGRT